MRIGIIGGNGFIGKHLTTLLKKQRDVEVTLFGKNRNIQGADEMVFLDLNKESQSWNVLHQLDMVYYLASNSIPASTWEKPMMEIDCNLTPFLKFMELIVQTSCKKIVFVSSAGTVYGTSVGKVNEDSPTNPFSPYGIVKLTMENYLAYYHKKYGLQYDIYRISNVYGEGQNTAKGLGIINTFLEQIIQSGEVSVFGDGEITRNYIYVEDVVKLMDSSRNRLSESGIFNFSSDDTLTINALIQVIKDSIDQTFQVHYVDGRKSDNAYIDLDNTKIKNKVGSYEFCSIQNGIKNTYLYIKNNLSSTSIS